MGYAGMLVNDVKWESSENENIWEKFVKAVKTKYAESEYIDQDAYTIEYDESSMTITYEDMSMETKFTYDNGIVSYVEDENRTDEELFVDSIWQGLVFEVFVEMFEYNSESVSEYLEDNKDLKIEKDGIEYVIKAFEIKDEAGTISGEAFTTLKLDIINGLKNYKTSEYVDEKIPEEEAPKTGFAIGVSIVLSLALLGGAGFYIYKYTNKKNKVSRI